MKEAIVRVAAAVILRPDGQVLLAQRPAGKAYAGWWEFPGGKLEPGETPREALDRELCEELGLTVRRAVPWLVRRFVYPHAHVELHFFRVLAWEGEPIGHDGQAFSWQAPGRFTVAPLLPANTPILRALLLPTVCGITMAEEHGEEAFLARAAVAFERGLSLVLVREVGWPAVRQRALAQRLGAAAAAYGAKVLVDGETCVPPVCGCAGAHWAGSALATAVAPVRPEGALRAAFCRTRGEVELAAGLEFDFVVVGPVLPAPGDPAVAAVGWDGFASLARESTLPVFAAGGLTAEDLDAAMAHGAHGIALRRAAWPDV